MQQKIHRLWHALRLLQWLLAVQIQGSFSTRQCFRPCLPGTSKRTGDRFRCCAAVALRCSSAPERMGTEG